MLAWIGIAATALVVLRVFLRYKVSKCTSKVQMTGKVVIVTGANSGIGFHTAKGLAKRGAKVILACRNENKAIRARNQIIAETGNTNVVYKHLDLASLSSVRKFCEDVNKTEERLDVLVNNAGVYGLGDRYTEDGIIEGMQINHFAPFLLTNLLLPLLKRTRPSRIVNLSSLIHYAGRFSEGVNQKGAHGSLMTYTNGKYCNMVFTVELARRLQSSGVTVNACHPGIVQTGLQKDLQFSLELLFSMLCFVCYRSAEEAAETVIYLSVAEECSGESGGFYVDAARWPHMWTCSKPALGKKLWTVSEKLLGIELKN